MPGTQNEGSVGALRSGSPRRVEQEDPQPSCKYRWSFEPKGQKWDIARVRKQGPGLIYQFLNDQLRAIEKGGSSATLRERARSVTGFAHSFRRFRLTHLLRAGAPEDLIRWWLGHSDKTSQTDIHA